MASWSSLQSLVIPSLEGLHDVLCNNCSASKYSLYYIDYCTIKFLCVCEIIMEFFEFLLSIENFYSYFFPYSVINFISKYFECWLFCIKGNILEGNLVLFILTAFQKHLWSDNDKHLTENESPCGTFHCCATGPVMLNTLTFFLIHANISDDLPGS